ncbi:ABC transporter ATP-binding protein [Arsenicicoccus dermatophilus]|uniref:ABC transporter ATP-binding protein n=1 Tax=Arsenicicoccus dermatophilus TaxID=1076331 RepID=UPI003916F9AE
MKNLGPTIRRLLTLLPPGARRYLGFFAITSAALTLLDTAALAMMALVLQPLMNTSGGGVPRVSGIPLLGTVEGSAVAWLLLAAGTLMIVKALLVLGLQFHSTRTFETYELSIGRQLFQAYIRSPWTERLKRSSTQLASLADVGLANMIAGVLLPAAQLPTEIVTMLSVTTIILVRDPLTACLTVAYLGVIALVIYAWVGRQARIAGRVNRDSALHMNQLMAEMVSALKEITLRDKSDEMGDQIHAVRRRVTRSRANIRFLTAVPKFATDIALVGGLLLIGGANYVRAGMPAAMASLALFGIAGFKIIPSITRLQNYVTSIEANAPFADTIIEDVRSAEGYLRTYREVGHQPLAETPRELTLGDVGFTYPGSDRPAVSDVDLRVPMGSSLALVGGSGAGKSTLVDLLLGLITPTHGRIAIDGDCLEDVLHAWRERVGYVPQEVTLFDGTIAQNVALTWSEHVDETRVRSALARAQLLDIVEARPGGIHGRIGERGLTLSGGQRQRLGIARALYVEPLVLVLDEATSALDTATEEAVSQAIREMHGEVTVVAVAHRLSTIRHSDQVCFMQDGRIAARGTFDEVVAASPQFAEQARLAGLA